MPKWKSTTAQFKQNIVVDPNENGTVRVSWGEGISLSAFLWLAIQAKMSKKSFSGVTYIVFFSFQGNNHFNSIFSHPAVLLLYYISQFDVVQ